MPRAPGPSDDEGVLDIIDRIDLRPIEDRLDAKDHRGTVPDGSRMMVALLVDGYAVGVFSSRRIARATYEDVAIRVLTVRNGDHVVQAFNSQALVDNEHRIIVTVGVGNQAPDVQYLEPMLERASANLSAAGLERPPPRAQPAEALAKRRGAPAAG